MIRRGRAAVRGQWAEGEGQWSVGSGQRAVELEFYCRTPGVEKEPVALTVFHDGKLIGKIA